MRLRVRLRTLLLALVFIALILALVAQELRYRRLRAEFEAKISAATFERTRYVMEARILKDQLDRVEVGQDVVERPRERIRPTRVAP